MTSALFQQSELVQAIFDFDENRIAELVIHGECDVNDQDETGRTALHASAALGLTRVVNLLIEHGARVDVKDREWCTPLHRACARRHVDVVDMLIKAGASTDAICRTWATPLHICAMHGAVECAEALLNANGALKGDRDGLSPLHYAAYAGNEKMTRLLCRSGALPDSRDKSGRRPIHWAAFVGAVEVVSLLLEHGADVNAQDKQLLTPLHCAAAGGHVGVLKKLLNAHHHRVPVDVTSITGHTPLHFAVNNGRVKAAQGLITAGANVQACALDGMQPLHIAVATPDGTLCTELLINLGAPVEATSNDGRTAVHLAAEWGRFARFGTLIENGASMNAETRAGITALHMSASYGHQLLIKKLLELLDAPDRQLPNGLSALHLACYQGFLNPIRSLLDAGSSLRTTDNHGRTPLHFGAFSSNPQSGCIIEYLLAQGSQFDRLDDYGRSPLHYAAFRANVDAVRHLISAGASVRMVDSNGRTPLHLSAFSDENGHCTELLCRDQSVCFIRDSNGLVPVHYSVISGHSTTTEVLLDAMHVLQVPSSGHPHHLSLHHLAAFGGHGSLLARLLNRFRSTALNLDQSTTNHLVKSIGLESDAKGRLPIHFAMRMGHEECCRILMATWIKQKALIAPDRRNITPLHLAAASGHLNCVRMGDSLSADEIRLTDSRKRSALMMAMTSSNSEIIEALWSRSSIEAIDSRGRGLLHRAAACALANFCEKLIVEAKLPVNLVDDRRAVTPLHLAAASSSSSSSSEALKTVQVLVEHGAKLMPDVSGLLPGDWAAISGMTENLAFLLQRFGSSAISQRSILGAAAGGHMACLKAIHTAQPFALNSVDRLGRTALHVAIQGGQLGSVKQLCELGSDMETMDIRGRTPLHTAVLFKTKDAKDIVVYLLDRGADLEKTDSEGDTVLHLACKEANETIASHLLNRIARLDSAGQFVGRQNAKKQTALHLSCAAGMFNVVAALLEISTESLNVKDENGRLPLLAGAMSDDHADCMALMLSVMQDADCRSDVHRRASSILSRSSMVDSTSQNTRRRSSNMVEEMNEFY